MPVKYVRGKVEAAVDTKVKTCNKPLITSQLPLMQVSKIYQKLHYLFSPKHTISPRDSSDKALFVIWVFYIMKYVSFIVIIIGMSFTWTTSLNAREK